MKKQLLGVMILFFSNLAYSSETNEDPNLTNEARGETELSAGYTDQNGKSWSANQIPLNYCCDKSDVSLFSNQKQVNQNVNPSDNNQ